MKIMGVIIKKFNDIGCYHLLIVLSIRSVNSIANTNKQLWTTNLLQWNKCLKKLFKLWSLNVAKIWANVQQMAFKWICTHFTLDWNPSKVFVNPYWMDFYVTRSFCSICATFSYSKYIFLFADVQLEYCFTYAFFSM